jgi:outer membrane protein TolC
VAERTRLLAIHNDVLPRARLVVETSTGGFAGGQGSMVEVLDAARDLRDIRMEEIMARSRLGAAWALLRREVGAGSTPAP